MHVRRKCRIIVPIRSRMKFKDAVERSVKMFEDPVFLERIRGEDSSMLKHMPILQDINREGFITTQSQAGRKLTGKSYKGQAPFIMEERAFIMGFMLQGEAAKFIQEMMIHTDKTAIFVPYCEDDIYLPRSLDVPLTITKRKGEVVQITTHSTVAYPKSVWESERKAAHLNKAEKAVHIFAWDPIWNRDAAGPSGLFKDVLRILKKQSK